MIRPSAANDRLWWAGLVVMVGALLQAIVAVFRLGGRSAAEPFDLAEPSFADRLGMSIAADVILWLVLALILVRLTVRSPTHERVAMGVATAVGVALVISTIAWLVSPYGDRQAASDIIGHLSLAGAYLCLLVGLPAGFTITWPGRDTRPRSRRIGIGILKEDE